MSSFTVSATASMPAARPSSATYIGVLPSSASAALAAPSSPSSMPSRSISFKLPISTAPAVYDCRDAVARNGLETPRLAEPPARGPLRRFDDGLCRGVFARSFSTEAARRSISSSSWPVRQDNVGQRGLAQGDGAGLVQDHRVELLGRLQGFAGADQDAVFRALARCRPSGSSAWPYPVRRGRQ